MRKKNMIFLLIIFKACIAQESFTYQESNILFGNQDTSFFIQQNEQEQTNKLTLSGYLWFDHLPKQDIMLIQFNQVLKEKDESKLDPLYPKCILNQNLLEENQNIREYNFIKNNPNCNIKQHKKQIYLQMKLIKNEQFYQIKILQNQDQIFSSDEFSILRQKYIFFAMSFNTALQKLNILVNNIQEGVNNKKVDLQINNLNESFINLELLFNKNQNFDYNGGIKKLNMFNLFTQDLESLVHVDQSIQNQIRDNLNLELNGALLYDKQIYQTHHLPYKVEIQKDIQANINHLLFQQDQKLQWVDILDEISTKIFILKSNFDTSQKNLHILKIEQGDLNLKIFLNKMIFEEDKHLLPPDVYHIVFEIQNKQNIKQIKLGQLELENDLIQFGFTIVQNQIQFFLMNNEFVQRELKFLNFPMQHLKPLNFTLFPINKSNIQFKRLLVLNSLTPFLFKDQADIQNCILPIMPTYNSERCLVCQNSVLSYDKQNCYAYCPENYKNIGGYCLPCKQQNCSEIQPTHLQVKRIDNDQFEITLNHELPFMNFLNYDQILKISQNKNLLEEEQDYDIEMISNRKIKVILNNDRTVYDDDIKIELNLDQIQNHYDENNNYVSESSLQYKAAIIRHLTKKEKIAVKIFAIILLSIFFITILIGVAIVVLGCKNNINELITKKIILLIQYLQFLPFLLLFRISLPSNLHYFLKLLFEYFIQYNEVFGFLKDQSPYIFSWGNPHPNFCDRQLSANYLYNFGLVFVIHFILLVVYATLKIYQKRGRKLSFRKREFVKKSLCIFEYNLLLLMFWLFSNQIFIFSTLTIENASIKNWVQGLSLFVSWFYIAIIVGFFITFIILFTKSNGFLNNQDLKYKMSFLFIGQRNKKIANAYEFIKLILQMCFCICLTYFRNDTFVQLITTLIFCFTSFIILVIVRPFEKRRTNRLQISNQSVLILAIFLFYMLAIKDDKGIYDIEARDKLGWIIISLLVFSQIISFYSMVKELIIFWGKISNSSKLIFYQRDEYYQQEFQPAIGNKFISEEKLNQSGMKKNNNKQKSNYGNLGNLTRFGKNLKQNFNSSLKKKQRQEYVQMDISGTDSLEYSSQNSDQMEDSKSNNIFNRF